MNTTVGDLWCCEMKGYCYCLCGAGIFALSVMWISYGCVFDIVPESAILLELLVQSDNVLRCGRRSDIVKFFQSCEVVRVMVTGLL